MAISFGEAILSFIFMNKLDKIEENTRIKQDMGLKRNGNIIRTDPYSQTYKRGPYTIEVRITDIDPDVEIKAKSLKIKVEIEEIE